MKETMSSRQSISIKPEENLLVYQERLRRLATEMALSEERQRREIAEDLHDHLGQGLAMLRLKLLELKGNAIFCGLDHTIEDMDKLLGQAIRYTRSLTFELSPPMLYEIGLNAAVEWLAGDYATRHKLELRLELEPLEKEFPNEFRVMIFKSLRELLINVVKHASAGKVTIRSHKTDTFFELSVEDDGLGFRNPDNPLAVCRDGSSGFGLFSISERLTVYGGDLLAANGEKQGARVCMRWPLSVLRGSTP